MAAAFGNKIKSGPLAAYEQDSICGTWEVFQAVIGVNREDKPGWAAAMGPHLSTATTGTKANKSPSFQKLCKALRRLAGEPWP